MKFDDELTLRAIVLGAILSALVAAYSAFAGLKVGGVYWPIATTSLVSLALLSFLGKTNSREITLMQTIGTAGGLLAAGVIFTIPAAWMLGLQVSYWDVLWVSLAGGILGIAFSYPLRMQMIEREGLPFAEGTAAASIIEAGDKGKSSVKTLFAAFSAGAVLSILRDWLQAIPGYFNLDTLKVSAGKYFSFGSSISLIPVAGGFLIGPRFTLAWFLGGLATYFAIVPYALSTGMFAGKADVIAAVSRPLGVGIVLGSAIAYFALKGIPALSNIVNDYRSSGLARFFVVSVVFAACALTVLARLDAISSILSIVGAFVMAYVASRVTGEMNVDPMEIFAMLVLLVAKIALTHDQFSLILIASVVTIAAGMAGDMLQDLKTGHLLRVSPRKQLVAQVIGLLAAALVIGPVLFAINHSFGIGNTNFPAPQAIAVSQLITANGLPLALVIGLVGGILLTLITSYAGLGIVPIAFGIGLYVPIELSVPLMVGGIIRAYADRKNLTASWRTAAAGVIAGEGLVGVLIAVAGVAALLK